MDAPGALALVLQALAIVAAIGAAGALAWSRMVARIDAVAREAAARAEAIASDAHDEVAAVHSRINEVKETYVRRDDFKEALAHIESVQRDTATQLSRLAEEQHATGRTLAAIAVKLDVEEALPVPRSAG